MVDKLKTILFVCTGNTCRSSMAEAIAKQKIKEAVVGPNQVKILSAGTGAFAGCPASPRAVDVLKAKNIDLSCHRSQRLSHQLIQEADYIFTMTVIQKQQVLYLDPAAAGKTFTLKEFVLSCAQSDLNIDDPYGGDEACYRRCADELEILIEKALGKVLS